MVFPATALPVKVELQLGGTWTDVTPYTYLRDRIQIVRGRRDEAGSFEPSECQLTFNNRGGRFSPRNPTGPYYGLLGRNTPVRVSAGGFGTTRLDATAQGARVSAPDTAGLSITGDIDLRVEAKLATWAGASASLINKSLTAGQRSYRMGVFGGLIFIDWSADGTNELFMASSTMLPITAGRQAIRATLDVDNGAGGRTANFYYATTIAGPWTPLGDPVIAVGTTSIFDGTDALKIGVTTSAAGATGSLYAAEVRQGIAGTVRANPDFTIQTSGATSFADAAGNTWTTEGGASLTNLRYRFYGEVPSWPQSWDVSENDVWTSVSAAGILRRLGQGTAALRSSIQRFVVKNTATAYGYWPMEDTVGSTSLASALPAGSPMAIVGTPELSTDATFLSSDPLPVLAGATFTGAVNPMATTGTVYVQMLLSVPLAGEAADGVFLRVFTTGTAARWDITYVTATDQLRLDAFDNTGASILSSLTSNPNGKPLSMYLVLVQNGANIDYGVFLTGYFLNTVGLSPLIGTLAGRTVGVAGTVQINPTGTLTDSTVGQLYVFATRLDGSLAEINAVRGYLGEPAGSRIARLCTEEGIACSGGGVDSEAMGIQKPAQLLELFAECEAVDLGQLFESRDNLGLVYRTRRSRALQTPALALNYNALRDLAPVEDDQATRNDVTVTRTDGSSARATLDVGTLSTQAPPNGVGRYDEQVELNLATDDQCPQQAAWRVAVGTVDEPRYPTLGVELAGTAFAASQALITSAIDLDCGDRITVTGTPVWLPPEAIDQHVVGYSETLGVRDYPIDYVCQPATPTGSAGLYDNAAFRWAADSSTLTGGITSSALSASVATASGPLWTTAGGDFPLDVVIAGERITVSAISGASSPQTFTFSARGVNGVTKAQSSGAAVQIVDPVQYAL